MKTSTKCLKQVRLLRNGLFADRGSRCSIDFCSCGPFKIKPVKTLKKSWLRQDRLEHASVFRASLHSDGFFNYVFKYRGFILFAYSGFVASADPLYLIVIGKLTAKRIKRGTNTAKITLFQIFSLGVLIFWFLFVVNFGGSPV